MSDGDTFDLTQLGIMYGVVDSEDEYSHLVKIDKFAMDSGAVKIISEGNIDQISNNEPDSIKEILKNRRN